ncbi:hypothetical protein SAMN04487969_101104 [Paenibacillus algorifonticola]|uniref:Uncharacterized protein n=1 Tax=Paenibacillus algorifonticola TaxID=684063 RepID=A0A1I1XUL5_9BACL|nr:hypothetical protein [Paenibacillus algorifonticola]SFE11037.1 hypothetical protein SAMN04487969_101104 [Paenibacillus algorifonticola]
MNNHKIKVVGGTILYDKLTSLSDEKMRDVAKAHIWLQMLKDIQVPVKWSRPYKHGTKIKFNFPQSQKEWDDSLAELKGYIVTVNEKHDLDMSIGEN